MNFQLIRIISSNYKPLNKFVRIKNMINFGSNMMHVDQFRKMDTYSPKSSPRGGRSPIVSRQDSSGTLKTTISLGKNPSIVHSGPFYLMKEPPGYYIFNMSEDFRIYHCNFLFKNRWE